MKDRTYLDPYFHAAQLHGDGFESLLWTSPQTQEARFDGLARAVTLHDLVVLDAGCGHADLLDWLVSQRIEPRKYIGIEAVPGLAAVAAERKRRNAQILRGDFVADKRMLDQDADVIIFSGSLNTLSEEDFQSSIRNAWKCAKEAVAFNFLSSPELAKAEYLHWRPLVDVLRFVATLDGQLTIVDDYISGDATVALRRS